MTDHLKSYTSEKLAKIIRLRALELCFHKRASHIGGAFSVADIIAVLYQNILNVYPLDPDNSGRDRLFFSKGHACTTLYATLEAKGFFSDIDLLKEFTRDGSHFTSHINHHLAGIELSTGSLGPATWRYLLWCDVTHQVAHKHTLRRLPRFLHWHFGSKYHTGSAPCI